MSVTAIWTAHCDRCGHWDDWTMADTKAEATAGALKQGWLVTKDRTLCERCRRPPSIAGPLRETPA